MKTSHTPGPWEMDSEACFISQHGDVLLMVGQVRGWGWLHRKYGEKEAFEIQKANGKLMAAAPDLLTALRVLLDAYKTHYDVITPARSIAESAIKKATE